MEKKSPPTHLTQHGVKKLIESKNLAQEFFNVMVTLQVLDVSVVEKKNIYGRVTLSDGVSKIVSMIPDKIHGQMVSIEEGRG